MTENDKIYVTKRILVGTCLIPLPQRVNSMTSVKQLIHYTVLQAAENPQYNCSVTL
jgi:hypothetical protein